MTQPPEYELSLLGLAEFVERYAGHIEDLSEDQRVLLLGQFAGAVRRMQARIRELYAQDDDAGHVEALPELHQVMLALGAAENWWAGDGDG